MTAEIYREIRESVRVRDPMRLLYSRQAYQAIPEINEPRILDIGCGRGEVTLELARISMGEIVGLDVDQASLDELTKSAAEAGLSDRIRIINCSMSEMNFPDESFDIVWAEGSIFVIGFEEGLKAWRRFIKPGGFLVVHEMTWLEQNPPPEILNHWVTTYAGIKLDSENIELIEDCGYELISHFQLPEEVWWHDYYGPLEERLRALREEHKTDQVALKILEEEQHEVDLYKKYSKWYGSAFYIMRKLARTEEAF
jgi:ubiquinone/menaquinone biosynthesis C-methylase UbiE